ncbi:MULTISPECIES: hypothetical protein [Pseudomonas]|uniref:hypothetical protein n=1 Tax=Pseudomonas TaxID=286 RepID=UPI00123C5639|nr:MULTISPECIES: hypothetical protein [Pseudomonas]QIB50069.1 hypothetical protein G3M63_02725 [Pseudomonas sp. OIL-1]
MTKLEETIVEQAKYQLQELRMSLVRPEAPERNEAISSAFWMLGGLTILANLVDSGMSDDAAKALQVIERESAQAMSAASLLGPIKR